MISSDKKFKFYCLIFLPINRIYSLQLQALWLQQFKNMLLLDNVTSHLSI